MALNVVLKTAFFEVGKRQIEVASQIGMDNNRLSQIVHGRIIPTPEERRQLAKALKKPETVLFPEVAA